MSQTLSPSSLPADTVLPGTAGSRLMDPVRGFLWLTWIEIRRSGGYRMLPLIIPLVWYLGEDRGGTGSVLWFRMSINTFQSYIVIGPLTAGLAAWLVGRDRRRRIGGLVQTAPMRPFRRDLILLGAAGSWGLVAYAVVGAWYLGQGVLFATWGGPDLAYIAVGATVIAVHATTGFLIGRVIRGRFAALVAVGVLIALPIGLDMYRTGDGTQLLRGLSPISLGFGISNDAIAAPVENSAGEILVWLGGLLGTTLTLIALMRTRSIFAVTVLLVSLVISVVGAHPLLSTQGYAGYQDNSDIAFERTCQTGSEVEVCLHPAWEANLSEVTGKMDHLIAPVSGLPGVPTIWHQSVSMERIEERNDQGGTIHWIDDQALVMSLADALFIPVSGERTASQLVVVTAIAEAAGISEQWDWPYGWPSEVAMQQGEGFYGPDEAELAAFKPEFDTAVDRFLDLSPEAQRAWLETNWDALRVGELTLEDMP